MEKTEDTKIKSSLIGRLVQDGAELFIVYNLGVQTTTRYKIDEEDIGRSKIESLQQTGLNKFYRFRLRSYRTSAPTVIALEECDDVITVFEDMNEAQLNALMKPRIFCKELYPNSPYKVKEQIELVYDDKSKLWICPQTKMKAFEFKHFKHLFKVLEWYEGREIHELPIYVRYLDGLVYKVLEHDFDHNYTQGYGDNYLCKVANPENKDYIRTHKGEAYLQYSGCFPTNKSGYVPLF